MTFTEKCALSWEDFQKNAGGTLHDLREDVDFCDVTLVCEDNQQILSHKVVLAASSPLLGAMLKSSQHSHPLLYLWGIKARDLARLVDFIYRGQVQVYQSDLDDFLALAKLLEVKGVGEAQPKDITGYSEENDTMHLIEKQSQELEANFPLDETESKYLSTFEPVLDKQQDLTVSPEEDPSKPITELNRRFRTSDAIEGSDGRTHEEVIITTLRNTVLSEKTPLSAVNWSRLARDIRGAHPRAFPGQQSATGVGRVCMNSVTRSIQKFRKEEARIKAGLCQGAEVEESVWQEGIRSILQVNREEQGARRTTQGRRASKAFLKEIQAPCDATQDWLAQDNSDAGLTNILGE